METRNILAILVLGLWLVVWQVEVSEAEPMGMAWTYQGRLMDVDNPANGLYDFQFKLFDDANTVTGNQLGGTIDVNDLDVIDGYFTVVLGFNDPNDFNGDARWLEIDVRPGDSNDPNAFVILSPRQEVTPTPYAIYAKAAGSIPGGINGGGVPGYIAKFTESNTIIDSVIYESSGNVGIGTSIPYGKLDVQAGPGDFVAGRFQAHGGVAVDAEAGSDYSAIVGKNTAYNTQGALAHQFYGVYGWGDARIGVQGDSNSSAGVYGSSESGPGVYGKSGSGHAGYFDGKGYFSGNVGIGTSSPSSMLHVTGASSESAILGYNSGTGAGIRGENATSGYGVYGKSSSGFAGYFEGHGYFSDNVGIGTTEPNATLEVNGAILRTGSTMFGANADTHINLGMDSTTGRDGFNYSHATVGGGVGNDANGPYATVSGGWNNTASYWYATVGGGYNNTASNWYTTVGGGHDNTASGNCATVPGGLSNAASGDYSFAAGRRAKANHQGTFVWADSTDANFASTGTDQFLIRASGGVGIGTSSPSEKLEIEGGGIKLTDEWSNIYGKNLKIWGDADSNLLLQSAGGNVGIGTTSPASRLHVAGGCITGSMCSDIRLKKNIEPLPLDDSILNRVMGLQAVTFEWKHRDDGKRQIGLIAQDVEEVFPEVVTTPDDDSCEKGLLATGLDAVLVEAIKELKAENELLKDRLEALEKIMQKQHFAAAK
jgi:hypothetical protein